MKRKKSFLCTGLALTLSALVAACAPAALVAKVTFVEPKNGATVSSPVTVKMAAENFTVEPAGEVKAGAGHLHITVDSECTPAGQVVTKDDAHLHYGKGQVEATLDLSAGPHTLCLQAGDGAHIALPGAGMTQKINITVK